ncbi:MAG: DUF4397 domain-containing protein [Anaerolineae bacterium]|nr:DUF4397 domain-containing protein [Anaerolineae bacterium]
MRFRLVLPLFLVLAIVGLSITWRASAQTSDTEDVGFVRFAHVAVDVPAIDIYQADGSQPLVSNLAYGSVTDFMALPTTGKGYVVRAAGSGASSDPLFQLDWGVKSNKSELILAAGLSKQKAFVLEPLTLLRNDTKGQARVRVINTVWGGTPYTVKTNQGAVLGQSLAYLKIADMDMTPGTYDFSVTTDAGQNVVSQNGLKLDADKVYTLLITGSTDGQPPVKLLVVTSDQDTTRVKIVNSGGKPVDIYLKGNDQPIAAGLAANANMDFVAVPSGAATLVIRDAGSAPGDKERGALETQLRPGRDVTLTLTDTGDAPKLEVTSEVLTVPASPNATTNTGSAGARATAGATAAATSAATSQALPQATPAG